MTNVVALEQPATFEDFWELQIRKENKPLTKAKWNAITGEGLDATVLDRGSNTYVSIGVLQATPEEIVEGYKRYRSKKFSDSYGNFVKPDKAFVLQPAQFLNQGRWMDG